MVMNVDVGTSRPASPVNAATMAAMGAKASMHRTTFMPAPAPGRTTGRGRTAPPGRSGPPAGSPQSRTCGAAARPQPDADHQHRQERVGAPDGLGELQHRARQVQPQQPQSHEHQVRQEHRRRERGLRDPPEGHPVAAGERQPPAVGDAAGGDGVADVEHRRVDDGLRPDEGRHVRDGEQADVEAAQGEDAERASAAPSADEEAGDHQDDVQQQAHQREHGQGGRQAERVEPHGQRARQRDAQGDRAEGTEVRRLHPAEALDAIPEGDDRDQHDGLHHHVHARPRPFVPADPMSSDPPGVAASGTRLARRAFVVAAYHRPT